MTETSTDVEAELHRLRSKVAVLDAEHARTLERFEESAEQLLLATERAILAESQAVALSRALARRIRRSATAPRWTRLRGSRDRQVSAADLELVRTSSHFKMAWYLRQNLDVVESGIDPLVHFVEIGGSEGRDPGPTFDANGYLDTHPGVRLAGTNPLLHFLRTGGS